ncbi:MAG: AAA family ATPase [Woeseiaceae bacterium]
MYTSFFGLNEKPFSITPDPRYLFMSERHGEALAHLVYGVTESGGFIQLTGEVGTGKTTLVRTLLLNRMPDNADVAVVLNPQLSVLEFLATICEELHIEVPHNKGSIKAQTDALNRHLLQAHAGGRRTILVVDEAQNLSPAVLEQVRLLTNLETAKQKLLQIILIGQPELRELLARNDLRQLAQRITGRYHLEPLSRNETAQYIEHRLKVAGAVGEVFDSAAKKETFRLSQGVPRLINVICDRALLGAYSREVRRVDSRLIRRAAIEVRGQRKRSPWLRPLATAGAIVGLVIISATAWWGIRPQNHTPPAIAAVIDESLADDASGMDDSEPVASEVRVIELPTSPQPETDVDIHPIEAEPPLNEQLKLAGDVTNTATALNSLFGAWGLNYDQSRSGCVQASDHGLACLYQRGSWAGLRQIDRPAILTLVDDEGGTHEVVLMAMLGDSAELSIGGVLVSHRVQSITDAWFGQYMLLWRPPGGNAASLGPGSRGPDVLRLRESLAAIDQKFTSNSLDAEVYNAELEQFVRAFQRTHRLDVDGVAGQQTQIVINSLLTVDGTPRLRSALLAQD